MSLTEKRKEARAEGHATLSVGDTGTFNGRRWTVTNRPSNGMVVIDWGSLFQSAIWYSGDDPLLAALVPAPVVDEKDDGCTCGYDVITGVGVHFADCPRFEPFDEPAPAVPDERREQLNEAKRVLRRGHISPHALLAVGVLESLLGEDK